MDSFDFISILYAIAFIVIIIGLLIVVMVYYQSINNFCKENDMSINSDWYSCLKDIGNNEVEVYDITRVGSFPNFEYKFIKEK